jgi:hypothetical protein
MTPQARRTGTALECMWQGARRNRPLTAAAGPQPGAAVLNLRVLIHALGGPSRGLVAAHV